MKVFVFTILLFLSGLTMAQKGWQYDLNSGFDLTDTAYLNKENIYSMVILQNNKDVKGYAELNSEGKLAKFFSNDTSYFFTYDSLNQLKQKVTVYGKFYDGFPDVWGDTTFYTKSGTDTFITIKKHFYSGKILALRNDSLNKAYHRVKYDDLNTGKTIMPLKKRLKTKFTQDQVYIVKIEKQVITKGKKPTLKTTSKLPLKRAYFEKPDYMKSEKPEQIAASQQENRLYHQKIRFDKTGRIGGFYFTHQPEINYTVKYNKHWEFKK